jgi:hypothetical protein
MSRPEPERVHGFDPVCALTRVLVCVLAGGAKRASAQPPLLANPETVVRSQGVPLDADALGAAAGTQATASPAGLVRIGWSRTDVAVHVDAATLRPAAGLGYWATFRATSAGTMATMSRAGIAILSLAASLLTGCISMPPNQVDNLCAVFEEKRGWYRHARRSRERWGIPISVMMAIAYQESSYRARARPPRRRLLRVIPWMRPSSAYGYAQATDSTWLEYKRATGRRGADRNDFDDAIDFLGWYNRRSADLLGLRRNDALSLYLAYHEGPAGFRRGRWRDKGWLRRTAHQVDRRAARYYKQLVRCESGLDVSPWWWPL